MSVLSIPIYEGALTLGTVTVNVTERDVAVEALPAAITFTGLPSRVWRLRTTVSSVPDTGAGVPVVNTITNLFAATTITLAPGASYHCYKDFEHAVGGMIHVTVELASIVGGVETRYGLGYGKIAFGAASASKTNQTYLAQTFTPMASARAQPVSDMTAVLTGIKDMGFDGVKTIALWPWCETASGVYDTAGYVAVLDSYFAECVSLGLKVGLALGGSTPSWAIASVVLPGQTFTIPVQGITHSLVNYQGPDNWTTLENFVTFIVNRYAASGLKWLFGPNEPNVANQAKQTPALNALWCKHMKAGIVAASGTPKPQLIVPELSLADTTYLNNLYATGNFLGNYDAVSYHPYPIRTTAPFAFGVNEIRRPLADDQFANGPGAAGTFVDAVVAQDAGARLWVSETGFVTSPVHGVAFAVPESRQPDQIAYTLRQLSRVQDVDGVVLWGAESEAFSEAPGLFGFGYRSDLAARLPSYAKIKTTIAAIRAGAG